MQEQPLPFAQVLAEEYKAIRGIDLPAGNPQEVLQQTGQVQPPLSALCISGGGIRSATFALGAIQAMAREGILEGFDYLSTVSGGGFIGSWLTAWIHRAGGLGSIGPQLSGSAPPSGPEAIDPVRHLREYNNYLTPSLGIFSADTWTLVATVARNILLNWLVIVPLLMATLMLPRVLFSVITLGQLYFDTYGNADAIAMSLPVVYGLPVAGMAMITVAIMNIGRHLPSLGAKNASQGRFLLGILAPLAAAAMIYIAHEQLFFWGANNVPTTRVSVALGLVFSPFLAGWLFFIAIHRSSFREKLKILFGPLTVAVLCMGISTGLMAWVISNIVVVNTSWAQYVVVAAPLLLLSFDLGMSVFVGLSSHILRDEDREWMARASAWIEMFCAAWLVVAALVLLAPTWTLNWGKWGNGFLAAAGAASAWASRLSESLSRDHERKPGRTAQVMKYMIKLAPAAFVVVLAIGLSVGTNWLLSRIMPLMAHKATNFVIHPLDEKNASANWLDHEGLLLHTPGQLALAVAAALFALSWLMARFININKFSLQSMYRNRLIRAYLGASNPDRNASRFTGFAENDNLLMREINPGFRPFHVINVTLNLVSGNRLDWQQRKAQSFTMSPLHSGNEDLGYRPSSRYGGPDGVSLGTAITISGAAASPNMGSYSSPAVSFIMTLLNARLGSWLGNPGEAGRKTWQLAGPRSAVASLVREALGLTTNTSPYVYLSDGGHFENLGLYEMVKRGCPCIFVLDGGADPRLELDSLGNALRKIRIDMNVAIDFEQRMQPLRGMKKRCAVATIRYSALDPSRQDGHLVYIKPMVLGNESPDVTTYKAGHPEFPHESTADQWFSESQTESYRMLAVQTMTEICSGWDRNSGLPGLVEHIRTRYLGPLPSATEKTEK